MPHFYVPRFPRDFPLYKLYVVKPFEAVSNYSGEKAEKLSINVRLLHISVVAVVKMLIPRSYCIPMLWFESRSRFVLIFVSYI